MSQLTLEQQFNICSFKAQVELLSHEQAKEMLIQMYEQMLVKDNISKELIKHKWGF